MRDRLARSLVRLLGRLPFGWARAIGGLLGRVAYRRDGREVHNARVNIALCFADRQPAQREALVRTNLLESGRALAEMLSVWSNDRRDWGSYADDNGFVEAGRRLAAAGNGLIIALPHLGNWELIAYHVVRIGPMTALYRPPRQAFMDDMMRAGRARAGITPVPTDRQGLRALHAALQRGEGIVILPDQVPKAAGASGVVAPFFGQPALTMTLISRLARKHKAPVLFAYAVFDPAIGRHRLHHFQGEAAIADASAEAAAAALNRDVERCVRAHPAHYQWTYRRFEVPGSDLPNPYKLARRHAPARA